LDPEGPLGLERRERRVEGPVAALVGPRPLPDTVHLGAAAVARTQQRPALMEALAAVVQAAQEKQGLPVALVGREALLPVALEEPPVRLYKEPPQAIPHTVAEAEAAQSQRLLLARVLGGTPTMAAVGPVAIPHRVGQRSKSVAQEEEAPCAEAEQADAAPVDPATILDMGVMAAPVFRGFLVAVEPEGQEPGTRPTPEAQGRQEQVAPGP
jgi:hypothetical protein